jgi:hypothetical protein
MWVYPVDEISMQPPTDSLQTGRLYLMYYDDADWGASAISPPDGPNTGGNVMYMAVDLTMPVTSNMDFVQPEMTIKLNQNAPNPFQKETTIDFYLSKHGSTQLRIYNCKGQVIRSLLDSQLGKGSHTAVWDGKDAHGVSVSSGIYFYRLQAGKEHKTGRMLFLR